ncbi:polysaccharide export protein [Kaistia dalseonensis]|uniref:Polysaccharide export outer membrane protein n=1 Tax=Kaistia dalseonensis TaxID=410840 RepID=A0ABU0H1M1_9HYPH|nr:polysaccharide biosynthesis/export family protein [Kaistia dalseonensis]MCX5493641.1 polysaccharide export protein [Kaistia dalseonensis]MDQ0436203.1 polysaccharide export outer membrane protein [Kaistia dalseonensis]
MRFFLLALTLIATALLGGCTSSYPPPDPATYKALVAPYRLDSGDRLRVVVFGQADLTNSYTIDQAGMISMPLVGTVAARGRTTQEIEADIATKLRGGYVRNPDVSVEVDRYRPFFIMGEVTSAGQYPYVTGMTVQTAVAIAGGFTPRAQKSDVDVTRQVNGKVMTVRLLPTQPVYPGDTLNVRERLF